ncbi:MAG: winged helix DNA-binding domain-containing protein [Odoribacteraceae bacterium]|jgi:hypothetical protein|nr:winged helix DNA-binding domain-containing protein [Odoribacteraceae bacterium]
MNAQLRTRLERHQLVNPMYNDPVALVTWMGAMQAQNRDMAKWAIGSRLRSATIREVDAALDRGDILRTHVMRPTWHYVPAVDIRWMLQLNRHRLKVVGAARDKELEITEPLYTTCNNLIERALAGGNHLTRKEIAVVLASAGIPVDTSRMIHFMFRAETEGIVCSGPDRGAEITYALLEERVPPVPPILQDESLYILAARYFRSHSPATTTDFAWWAGLIAEDARRAVYLLNLETRFGMPDERRPPSTLAPLPPPPPGRTLVHLLPAFDEYLLAYKDRSLPLDAVHRRRVVTVNGTFSPAILRDGRVVGTWQKTTILGKPGVKLFPLEPIDDIAAPIATATEAYKTFLAGERPAGNPQAE